MKLNSQKEKEWKRAIKKYLEAEEEVIKMFIQEHINKTEAEDLIKRLVAEACVDDVMTRIGLQ